jgi:hypothetical protein
MDMQVKVAEHRMDMQHQHDEHQMDLVHGEQQHQQTMAVNAQMGEAKIEMAKRQAAEKPKPNGAST